MQNCTGFLLYTFHASCTPLKVELSFLTNKNCDERVEGVEKIHPCLISRLVVQGTPALIKTFEGGNKDIRENRLHSVEQSTAIPTLTIGV